MQNELVTLGTYRHYKGGLYEVVGIGNHSETLEKVVIYESLEDKEGYPKGTLWVRPLHMFTEQIEIDGKKMPRFALTTEESLLS